MPSLPPPPPDGPYRLTTDCPRCGKPMAALKTVNAENPALQRYPGVYWCEECDWLYVPGHAAICAKCHTRMTTQKTLDLKGV